MAVQLVEHLAAEWDPARYTDDYQKQIMRVIDAKLKGEKIEVPAGRPERKGNVVDLMARLQQSLDAANAGRPKTVKTAKRAGARAGTRKKARASKRARVA